MATASPPLPPPSTVNLWVILTESKRIINAHSRHFLALSVLFLLPLCFSVTVYPSVSRLIIDQSSSSHNSVSLLRSSSGSLHDVDPKTVLLLLVAYISVVAVFNLLAIGSIAYSVYQGFYGRPVKLVSAVRSSFASFLPLLATLISSNFILLLIFLILGFLAFLITRLMEIDYTSPSVSTVVTLIFLAIVVKLYSNWILSWVVVVVESSWGLTPLKRSRSLVRGMESVSMSMILVFAVAQASFVWVSTVAASMDDDGKLWTKAFFVVQIVVTSAVLTVLMLYNVAASTVMYMYCKAVRGELAWEIAEEFAREYVSLPFDDGKVPHLVSVAYNNV